MKDSPSISPTILKQLFFLLLLFVLFFLISYELAVFIPSVLGAITLYIICRKYHFYFTEKCNWKPALSSFFIIFITLLVFILPIYFTINLLVSKLGNVQSYTAHFNEFLDKIHAFIYDKTSFDILSKENMDKIKSFATKFSTMALSMTFNAFTVVASMYFILYFLFCKARVFEAKVMGFLPLKKVNMEFLATKFRKLVLANSVGIPIVAIGQGIVAVVGYLIFGAPSVALLFILTVLGSILPIVGASIIYIPVSIYLMAQGELSSGVGLLLYCVVVVGSVDNLLRFTVLRKIENIHPLVTVFGILLGVNLFGFMGLVFGPVVISLSLLLLEIYQDEFSSKTPKNIEDKQDQENK